MTAPSFGLLRLPRTILFGEGQRAALGPVARGLGQRVFLVTDPWLAGQAEWFGALVSGLTLEGLSVDIYAETTAELPMGCLDAALAQAGAFAPDVIVGLGGGSCMDLAKLVALLMAHGGHVSDYYGELKVPGPILPVIAVPTTAGTGSEVTPIAVVEDPARATKVGVSSPYLIPEVALCDPELTHSCPPALTAASGVDAITHAVESFTARVRPASADLSQASVAVGKNLLSDHHALTAISLLTGALERAVADGSDAAARRDMMLGALHAGIAFGTSGVAAAHALQYPVGAATHTPHGIGVAALLPYVMRYNLPERAAEFAAIGRAMGIADDADAAIDALAALFARVGVPRTLAELGMPEERLGWAAEQGFAAARLVNNNPRTLSVEALEAILRAAFDGDARAAGA